MSGLWSVALKAALEGFATLGLDVEAICRGAGIPRAVLDDPDGRVPMENGGRIWPLAEAQWNAPALGLRTGSSVAFGRITALDYTVATAATVGAGLERLGTYWAVVTGGLTGIELHEDAATDTLTIHFRGYSYPQLRDYAVALTCVRLHAVDAPPAHLALAGPPRTTLAAYRTALGCTVEFDAPETVLRLAPGAHRRPVPPRYPGLEALVEREAQRLMRTARTDADPLADVRREITSLVGPEPVTLAAVARGLGQSPRQLQRRLARAELTFPKLVDACRRALAEQHLARPGASIAEIAYVLGFSEPSAFSRAFKRWTGVSPAQFREGAEAAPPPT